MITIKSLRLLMGLSQQQLADYLSIQRTQLSMAENGLRNLPAAAAAELDALRRQLVSNTSPGVVTETALQSEAVRKVLKAHSQKYSRLATATNHKLEKMATQYNELLKALQMASGRLAELPRDAASKKKRLVLEVTQNTTLKKMSTCDAAAQTRLMLQAKVYSRHAQEAQAMMM